MIHGQTCNLSLILCSHSSHNLFSPDTDELLGSITHAETDTHCQTWTFTRKCTLLRLHTYTHARPIICSRTRMHNPLPGLKSSLQPHPVLASLLQLHCLSVVLLTRMFRWYRASYCCGIMALSVMLAGDVKSWRFRIINDIGFFHIVKMLRFPSRRNNLGMTEQNLLEGDLHFTGDVSQNLPILIL